MEAAVGGAGEGVEERNERRGGRGVSAGSAEVKPNMASRKKVVYYRQVS